MRLSALCTRLLLALALVSGWQTALEHPIVHVDELGELVHAHDGHSHEDSGPLCDTLAALTACAASAQLPCPASPAVDPLPQPQQGAPRAAEAPPFLSHGPPASV